MKNQVTFGHLLFIMSILVLPLIGWGVTIETRFKDPIQNAKDIEEIKEEVKQLQETTNKNYIKILEKLNDIELEMQNKKNR